MMIKALKSFAGAVTMAPGDVRDIDDEHARDYIRAGYAAAVEEPEKEPKKEQKNEPTGAEAAPAAAAVDEPKKPAKRSRK